MGHVKISTPIVSDWMNPTEANDKPARLAHRSSTTAATSSDATTISSPQLVSQQDKIYGRKSKELAYNIVCRIDEISLELHTPSPLLPKPKIQKLYLPYINITTNI